MKMKKLIYGLAGVVLLASPAISFGQPENDCFATVDYLGNTNDSIRLTHPSEALETNGATHQVIISVLAPDGTIRGSGPFPVNFVERETVSMTMKQIFDAVELNIYDGQARGNIIQLGTPADFLISGIVRHGLSVVPLIFQCHAVIPD